jgi:hypothetical protein
MRDARKQLPGVVVLASFIMMACGADRSARRDETPADSAARPSAMTQYSLQLQLDLNSPVAAGAPVRFVLRIRNASSRATDLYLRGRNVTFDVTVTRENGEPAWRRLEGEMVPAIVQLRTLAAGETVAESFTWDLRTRSGAALPPGRYRATATLLMETAQRETAPVTFEVVE